MNDHISRKALLEKAQTFDEYIEGQNVYFRFIDENEVFNAPAVEAEPKWISVKEHLPQENEPEGATCEQVQVLLDNGVVSTGWCNRHTKLWWHLNYGETHFIGYDYEHTPVIAWQPLEQPPKGE